MKNVIKMLLGLFIIATVIWGYNCTLLMYELTCLSNLCCGAVLLLDGVLGLARKKGLPAIFYQLVLPCICVVFIVTVGSKAFALGNFNFAGGFFFMHAINPVLFLAVYLFCTDYTLEDARANKTATFVAPAAMMAYALFDLVRFIITGEVVYGIIPTDMINLWSVIIIAVVLYALMAFMSFGLIKLKKCCKFGKKPENA